MEGYDFNHMPGFPIPLPSAPNPDEGQFSRLNERRDGDGRRGKKRLYTLVRPWLHVGSGDGRIDATPRVDLGYLRA